MGGDELTRELHELRSRHEAVVDVLHALSGSGMRLQPILDQIVEVAAGLCRADSCFLYLADGELLRMRANFGQPQEVVEYERAHPDRAGPNTCTGRVAPRFPWVEAPRRQAPLRREGRGRNRAR
jgi:two-component system, NtrC family, sensor kinase